MRMEIQTVTPLMAETYLSDNDANRKINKAQIELLVRTIKSGNWVLTHQGVAFYEDGSLADGQHRLTAIMESGVPCKLPVFFGVEKTNKTIMAVDCGKLRSVTDSSAITGITVKAADIALVKCLEFGVEKRVPRLTHLESSDLCKIHQQKLRDIKYLMPTNKNIITSVGVKTAICKALELGVDRSLLKSICGVLYTGEYSSSNMIGAVKLRNKLLSFAGASSTTKKIETYNMVLNTCVKISKGEEINRISSKKNY